MSKERRRLSAAERLRGVVQLEVSGAMPAAFLNECTRRGVELRDVREAGALTIRVSLPTAALTQAEAAAQRCGCTLRVVERRGLPERVRALRPRFLFALGLLVTVLGLFVSSLFIWDVCVTENPTVVPDGEILAVLEELGVDVGSFWPGMKSDMLRARALQQLPELSFLAVNIHGSRAEVIVRGKTEVPEIWPEELSADVTARRAGVITEMHVLEGESLVQPGDTVAAGEVLVSGQRHSELSQPRFVRSRAEVWARTWHEITAVAPLTRYEQVPQGRQRTIFGLILGKRRMNFALPSGIYGETCDRMTDVYTLTLPGAPHLPIALVRERVQPVTLREVPVDPLSLQGELEAQLLQELASRLPPESNIVSTHFTHSEGDGCVYAVLRAECRERIDSLQEIGPG